MGREFDRSVAVGISLLAALVVANAAISDRNTRHVHDDAAWVTHTHQVRTVAGTVRTGLRTVEAAHRTHLLTGEQPDAYRRATTAVRDDLGRLAAPTADNPDQQARITVAALLVAQVVEPDEVP